VLLVLLAASGLVFIIACSNVANLILARSVRREGELAIRAALGASAGALRRTLLAESLILCVAGATLGVISARPLLAVLARYASRFSVRALELSVDSSMLWVGAGLAVVSAVLLAFVPRLPSANASQGSNLASGSVRITGGTNRRLRIFAVTQIAASFILLAGASMLLKTLLSIQAAQTGLDTRHVLAINVPTVSYGKTPEQVVEFYKESIRRIEALPGVTRPPSAWLSLARCRQLWPGPAILCGWPRPRARRGRSSRPDAYYLPRFFAALGVPIIAGRDFNALDGEKGKEPVVIVSQTLAQKMFPNQDPINRHVYWNRSGDEIHPRDQRRAAPHHWRYLPTLMTNTSSPAQSLRSTIPLKKVPCLAPPLCPHRRKSLCPRHAGDPAHSWHVDRPPVERAATLEDVRAEVLTPDRLNTVVFGVFAAAAACHCLGRSSGRAGVFGERANARIWHSARHWIAAAGFADRCHRRRRGYGGGGRSSRRGIWLRAGASGRELLPRRAYAQCLAGGHLRGRAVDRGGRRIRVAGGACCANQCHRSAAVGVRNLIRAPGWVAWKFACQSNPKANE